MLCEDCLQLLDFIAQPLTLSKGGFQFGSKISLVLHESTRRNNGTGSGMFWVDDREPLQTGNIAKYLVCGDKMIDQSLIPQLQRYRQLESVLGTKAQVESILLNQDLGHREFRFGYGEDLQPPAGFPGFGHPVER